jgi:LmbE family N-acetylglucosaminyl deacetylase
MPEEQFTKISFYIVAHADDWQLFMQPHAYNDLVAPQSKVVFIVTTAGDAGGNKSYWEAREEGMKSSIRFCLAPFNLTELSGTREINTHAINFSTINNVTNYFLRLPDGGLDSNGFLAQGYQSLSKLKSGQHGIISAVDKLATYCNWSDFCATLQSIIVSESRGITSVSINYLNPQLSANPNDHPDHIATGQAVQSMPILSQLKQSLFVGYSVSKAMEKLQGAELFWKVGMFAAYEKAVFDCSGYSTLKEGIDIYTGWCLSSGCFITVNPE